MDLDRKELVKTLREEAREVKDCFTRYSFQTFLFSSAVLGVIARYSGDHPAIQLASVLVVILILAVARIGTYKYFTANRNYGYQLHLHRRQHLNAHDPQSWPDDILDIGWEEAMRAWRIVQATCFRSLYAHGPGVPNLRWPKAWRRSRTEGGLWFEPARLVGRANYHAGTYLTSMTYILYIFLVAALIPPIVLAVGSAECTHALHSAHRVICFGVAALVLVCAVRVFSIDTRRRILEKGFMSIHSCAIMWEAVAISHALASKRALEQTGTDGLSGYTKELGEIANSLARGSSNENQQAERVENRFRIHTWIREREQELRSSTGSAP